jgi:SAM-dependent methyltransferase
MKKKGSINGKVAEQFKDWQRCKSKSLFNKRFEAIYPFIPNEGRVLDAGCGDFDMLEALQKTKNITPFGIDIMPHDTRVIKSDCSEIPFKEGFFDCVICTAVMEHVPDQKKVLLDFNRVLKKGGMLIITTPNPLYSGLAWLGSLLNLKYKEGFDNSLSIGKLSSMVKECGFIIQLSKGFLLLPFNYPTSFIDGLLGRPIAGYTILMNQLIVCKTEG